MAQKLVVIGAGMASGRMLEHLFEEAPGAYEVTLFNAEPRGNYNRIMLSPVLSGEKTFEDIVTHVIPALERRGLYDREYVPGTLRHKLFGRGDLLPEDLAWAHVDVYAWNDNSRPGKPAGGEAQGLRAAWGLLKARYPKK